jgi:hypothetical protein
MIVQTSCTIFGLNLLKGLENFTGASPYVYKMALFNANADLNNATTAYSSTNEVVGTGYTAGGNVLTPIAPGSDTTNNTAFVSFEDVTWNPANFTTRGALIYNSTTGAAVFVLNFGSDKLPTSTFTVTFPTADSTNAIIRIT